MRKMDKDAGGNNARVWKIAGAAFLIVAIACTVVACAGKAKEEEAESQYESLAEQTTKSVEPTPEPSSEESSEESEAEPEETDPLEDLKEMGVPIPEKEVDFEDLQENTNEDIYAWIYIPDTPIDYPILQHDTDNTFYLEHNIDGSLGRPGCIYTENYNAKDFSDSVTVMYGHNMRVGTMFAALHKYEDSEFAEEHPYIYIYTPDGLLVYEIFSAHKTSNEHILYAHNYFTNKWTVEKYIEDSRNVRVMGGVQRENVEADADNCILVLSTCVGNEPDKRYVVQGVLLNGGKEWEEEQE